MLLLGSGHLGMAWQQRRAAFNVTWSNPVWEWLEFQPESQREQILQRLAATLQELPPAMQTDDWMTGAPAAMQVPSSPAGMLRRQVRRLWLEVRRACACVVQWITWF